MAIHRVVNPLILGVGETNQPLVGFGVDNSPPNPFTPDPTALWATSNPAIASISAGGPASQVTVTGMALGTATVTITHPATGDVLQFDVQVVVRPNQVPRWYFNRAGGDKPEQIYPE